MAKITEQSSGEAKAPVQRLQVREAANAQQRRMILKFRNQIMVEELGISTFPGTDERQHNEDARDEIARHLFLIADNEIAGCLRLCTSEMIDPSEEMIINYGLNAFRDFEPACLSFTDHMVIAQSWRDGKVPALMKAAAFKLARNGGALFDFTYCPPALVGRYEKIGYRCYSGQYLETDEGLQVPMILVMDDVEHLKAINSPFALLATSIQPDPGVVDWFRDTFPDAAGRRVKALRDEDRLWEYLTKQLHQNPLHGVPLFDELSYSEARRFVQNATTLVLRGGDRLARAGDLAFEAFVVLSGSVEIRDRNGSMLARFDKGATVGEIAYLGAMPRTADILVTEDAEVLVLTQEMFRKTIQNEPAVTSKILFNLTLILAERLRATSLQLSGYTQGL
ncbi:MAG: cyclic nucleotide-binding domain-containing protein [Proteobacteria bacterium]|nr:cyclic nucleotide-binding domain-containing protein [Pseudomonadota bacterium]